METVVCSRGKFVLPSKILKQLGIKDKAFLHIDVDTDRRQIVLTPLRGKYKGKGLMKSLMREKQWRRDGTS